MSTLTERNPLNMNRQGISLKNQLFSMKKFFLAGAILFGFTAMATPGGERNKYLISVDLNKVVLFLR